MFTKPGPIQLIDVGKVNGALATLDDNIGTVRSGVPKLAAASVERWPGPIPLVAQ
ncbi:hypothetical protein [Cycloclasticus pugetii]|uniref:hypothetical protein n=1 Tax=Cycloclasticus pugetii TaxID=34068 RepID=UPI003A915C8B